ncbi:UNVERIFIED_CONTAM: hypothetical protein K2H54_011910 [Gekko kuhli]
MFDMFFFFLLNHFTIFEGEFKKTNDTKSNETNVMCIGKIHGSNGHRYSTPPLNPSCTAKGEDLFPNAADGLVGCHPLVINGSASGNVHNYHRLILNRLSHIPPVIPPPLPKLIK